MTIIERVGLLIEMAGSQTKFARAANLSVQTVAGLMNRGANFIRSDTLEGILRGYPNLNARWLISGEGEMWMDGQAPNAKLQFPNIRQSQGDKNILVPVRAYAGYVVEYGQEKLPDTIQQVVIPGITGEARTWEIEGTSMEPVIMEGDWVSGHRVASAGHMIGGNIYILVTRSSGIHIKHAWLRGSRIYCQPANYNQEPYYIDAEDVVEIWDAKVRVTRNLLVPYPVAVVEKDQAKWLLPVVRIDGDEEK